MSSEVNIERRGHVAVLELDNPPNNHVSVANMRELADRFHDLDGDDGVRAYVLASAGKVFCAGADLVSRQTSMIDGAGGGVNALYIEAVRLFSVQKPIVAAVQGAAVGAGLGLAVVADFRVAAPEARFSANFVKLGFHPGFGLTHTLPRLIGEQRAALMFLTGRRVRAEEAHAWGLVDEMAALADVRTRALALAEEIAENAPLAIEATRATLRQDLAAAVKAQTDKEFIIQDRLRQTEDYREGVRAVAERRPGRFLRR
jgi:enoyl-CoA hydratase/carnithine racemase